MALGAGLGIIRLEDVDGWLDAGGRYDLPRFAAERDRIRRESLVRNPSDRPARPSPGGSVWADPTSP